MAIPVGTVIEVTQLGRLFGQTLMNVYHYIVNIASSTPGGVQELEDFLAQHWNVGAGTISDDFINLVPSQYELFTTTAQAVFPVRARKVVQLQNNQGENIATTVSNIQASITLTADLAGRRYIGGKRIPIPAGVCIDGLVSPGTTSLLVLYAGSCTNLLNVALGGAQYAPVIYHRPPAPPPQFSLITDAFPQATARVLRRRTVGLGI